MVTTAPAPRMPDRLTTVAGAASFFDVTPVTIRRWIASGRIAAWRVNARVIRVDIDSVVAERVLPRVDSAGVDASPASGGSRV